MTILIFNGLYCLSVNLFKRVNNSEGTLNQSNYRKSKLALEGTGNSQHYSQGNSLFI